MTKSLARRPHDRPLRVLVTGGAGLIGAALVRELAEGGASVLAVDDLSAGSRARLPRRAEVEVAIADVSEPGTLARLLAERDPFDVLVHLAARVGVRTVLADPERCRRENEAGTRAVIDAVAELEPRDRPRVFAASSSEVYADKCGPLAEGDALRTADARGRFAYAASKIAGERALDAARALWARGRGPLHLRFFNVVGPGQDAASGMVLPTFVEAARTGAPLRVHGSGRQVRTLAHVDDVARTLAALVAMPDAPEGALNVGGTARASVLEIARAVIAASGRPDAIVHVDARAELGSGFRAIETREPDLRRLASLGVPMPTRGLDAIVADAWRRHPPTAGRRASERTLLRRIP